MCHESNELALWVQAMEAVASARKRRKGQRAALAAPLLPTSRATSAARGAPADRVPKAYGTRMMLPSIVTAARAKALPDRLAPVVIVMLE
jgi:hypothetical protein